MLFKIVKGFLNTLIKIKKPSHLQWTSFDGKVLLLLECPTVKVQKSLINNFKNIKFFVLTSIFIQFHSNFIALSTFESFVWNKGLKIRKLQNYIIASQNVWRYWYNSSLLMFKKIIHKCVRVFTGRIVLCSDYLYVKCRIKFKHFNDCKWY